MSRRNLLKAEGAAKIQPQITRMAADLGNPVPTGEFGADMQVDLTDDGPVTIIIDSKMRE